MPTLRYAFVLVLSLLVITPDRPMRAQNPVVSVGIVDFQDDSGSNVPQPLRRKIAQELQQNLLAAYKDILPRLISDANAAAGPSLTIEQLVALGKQSGASFMIRGGVLSAIAEPMAGKSGMKVQIYAEVISVDNGSVVTTARSGGAATQADPIEALSAVDPGGQNYPLSAVGQAFSVAVGRLAEPIHQAIATPAAAADVSAPAAEETSTADADADLQQLITQAESILTSGGNASTESITAVQQALQSLQAALAAKANLMEGGKDTAQADQDIATGKQALQTAIAQVTAELSAPATTSTAPATEEATAEKKGLLTSIDEAASQALSILQKIQEMRSTLAAAEQPAATTTTPAEQPVSEGTGVVVDENGNPVEGAQVTDQTSGASTVTDSHGVYHLQGLLGGKMTTLTVQKGLTKTSAQTQVWRGQPAVLDFQMKSSAAAKGSTSGVLPSTVLLKPAGDRIAANATLTGIVLDAHGRPLSRALVNLKGLGVARTNSQGQYMFLNVPAGTRELIVDSNGMTPKTTRVQVVARQRNEAKIQFSASEQTSKTVTKPVVSKTSRNDLARPIVVNRPVPVRSGGVAVQVIDAKTRRPISGVTISMTGQRSLSSDSAGRVVLTNLSPGIYQVSAAKAGYSVEQRTVVVKSGETATLSLNLSPRAAAVRR
jgi:protocatechuate 3,4-dioxygenase beta subunit